MDVCTALNRTSWFNHFTEIVPVATLVFGNSSGVMFYQTLVGYYTKTGDTYALNVKKIVSVS